MPLAIKFNKRFYNECPTLETFLSQVNAFRAIRGDRMTRFYVDGVCIDQRLPDLDDLLAKTWLDYSNADEVSASLLGEPHVSNLAEATFLTEIVLENALHAYFGQAFDTLVNTRSA